VIVIEDERHAIGQRNPAGRPARGTLHRDEAAGLERQASPVAAGAFERDRQAPSRQAQWHDKPAVRGELVQPGGWNLPHAGRRDQPVVRCAFDMAVRAIGGHDDHVGEACFSQRQPGTLGRLPVVLDGRHVSTHPGQQGSVVAGAGADLQHPMAGPDIQLLQHHGDHRGRGSGAERAAVRMPFGDHGVVDVGVLDGHLGHEQVARHRTKRCVDGV
jgi:hypothetical protein